MRWHRPSGESRTDDVRVRFLPFPRDLLEPEAMRAALLSTCRRRPASATAVPRALQTARMITSESREVRHKRIGSRGREVKSSLVIL
jgi:hypothetical protein